MDTKNEKPTPIETLLGGTEITVTKRDGSTEKVKVCQIPISRMHEYLMALDDEAATVDLLCYKVKGWSDKLAEKSFLEVLETGERINAESFQSWLARRTARMARLNGGVESRLPTTLPSSASNAA